MSSEKRPDDATTDAGADSSIWRGGDFEKSKRPSTPILTPFVCTLMLLVFVSNAFQNSSSAGRSLEPWGHDSPDSMLSGAYWGYITTTLVHLEPLHLILNLYWTWILGGALERSLGPLRWLAFFVTSAWVSSGIQFLIGGSGIGMSGVVYAMFGFGWRARERLPEFQRVLSDQTYRLFIVWLVFCIVVTYMGVYSVGNGAHVGGMLFGMAVAEVFVCRRRVPLMVASLGLMSVLSTLPLVWCPWSVDWVSFKANEAMSKQDYTTAIRLYHRALDLGQDPAFVWDGLAQIYGYQKRTAEVSSGSPEHTTEYAEALAKLREVAPETALSIESRYGKPDAASVPNKKP